MKRPRYQVNVAFTPEEWSLFEAAKKKLGENSNYGATKKIMIHALTQLLTGEAQSYAQPRLNPEDQIVQTRSLLERLIEDAKRKEQKLFRESTQISRSGKYNPDYGNPQPEEEARAHRAIMFKRELTAQRMKTYRNAVYWLERVENKDWSGFDEKLPQRERYSPQTREESV